uniref:RING-type domain-containing protein n=1 Tax=viral metagenome TaxID=1070528 RepID=A0A6C0DXD3_9ZZZZ
MPSKTRSSSRLRSSAAKKIQKHFRSRKRLRSKASRKIQTRARAKIQGNKTRKLINRVKTIMQTDNTCPICFEPMTEKVATLLPCGHRFHTKCIKDSMPSTRGECPLCRTGIVNIPYIQPGRANRTFGNVPLSQQQPQAPPAQPAILDPTQRRQYILQRLREIEMLQQAIIQQRPQLPWPPEIPDITYEEALNNEIRARQIVEQARILLYEASENYQNYRNVRIDGNPLDQDVTNMYYITSDLLTRARENRNNATRIVEEIGGDNEEPDLR